MATSLTANMPAFNASDSEWEAWRQGLIFKAKSDPIFAEAHPMALNPPSKKSVISTLDKYKLITDKDGNRLLSDDLIFAGLAGDATSKKDARQQRDKIIDAWADDVLESTGNISVRTGEPITTNFYARNYFSGELENNKRRLVNLVTGSAQNWQPLARYLNKTGRPIQPVGGDIPITPLATKSIAELDTKPISALNTAPISALNTAPISALNTAPIKKIEAPAPSFLTLNDLQKQNYVTNTDFTNALNSQNNVILGNQTVPSSQNTQLLTNLTNRNQQLGTSISSGMQSQNKNLATNTNTGLMNSFKNFQIPTAQQNGVNLGNYNDNRNTATDTWWSNYIATRR